MAGYSTPKYANEQVLREMGYQGDFGEGGAASWVRNTGQLDKYYNTMGARGITEGKTLANLPLPQQVAQNVNNPVLPNNAQAVPQMMHAQPGEMLTAPAPVNNQVIAAPQTVQAPVMQTAQANTNTGQVDPNQALGYINPQAGQYQATTVSPNTPQAQAATGQVNPLATVQGQLSELYKQTTTGETPLWAQGAVNQANSAMAARGLGKSSIAAGAITAAVQQSALNIAAPDAASYFQMDMANLNNQQQTNLFNTQLKQQSLLSDQSALNAAAQFNASSASQVQQFQANLVGQIQMQNGSLRASLEQFNAGQENQMGVAGAQLTQQAGIFNVQQKASVDQFNSNLRYQADSFNAQMQNVVDQSNVAWRRQINTANTASINASNQLNVQNAFNMSQSSLNALWQNLRDNMQWAWQSSENQADRDAALGRIASNRDSQIAVNSNQFGLNTDLLYQQAIGQVATSILGNLFG